VEGGARLVMIDRDGVINEDSGEFIKSVAEWRPIAGSLEAIAALHRAGWRVAVVTNQSGIGRGLYDATALAAIHRHMLERVRAAGGHLAGIYYCEAAEGIGARPMLVRTGTGATTEQLLGARVVPVFDDLAAAARSLLDEPR